VTDEGDGGDEFASTQLRGEQPVAAVTLVKALGGGWQETAPQ
jgi:hypothetical protein